MRIFRYISALLLSSFLCFQAFAQDKKTEQAPVFCGVAVMADVAGPVMKLLDTRFHQMEVGARLNFREHYFPIAELGVGECDREGEENNNSFHVRAPYMRLGMDYNFNKKLNGNRFFGGLRYAFSSFRYDIQSPDFQDPVYGGPKGFKLDDQSGRMQWAEFCLGIETKLWEFIRLGWTIRFKTRLHQTGNTYGDPYYVPGFGRNASTAWGGTCNLVFDIGRKPKTKKLTINKE